MEHRVALVMLLLAARLARVQFPALASVIDAPALRPLCQRAGSNSRAHPNQHGCVDVLPPRRIQSHNMPPGTRSRPTAGTDRRRTSSAAVILMAPAGAASDPRRHQLVADQDPVDRRAGRHHPHPGGHTSGRRPQRRCARSSSRSPPPPPPTPDAADDAADVTGPPTRPVILEYVPRPQIAGCKSSVVPCQVVKRADYTIDLLRLNEDPQLIRERSQAVRDYLVDTLDGTRPRWLTRPLCRAVDQARSA